MGDHETARAGLPRDPPRLLTGHVTVSLEFRSGVEVGRLEQQHIGAGGEGDEALVVRAIRTVDERRGAVADPCRVTQLRVRGPGERHPQGPELDLLGIVVFPELERVLKARRVRTDRSRKPVEHLEATFAGNVDPRPPVLTARPSCGRLRDLSRQRQQVEHVVDVHVRDHDRVDRADQTAFPRAPERARSKVEQDTRLSIADQVAGARSLERDANPESEHLDPHGVSIRTRGPGHTREVTQSIPYLELNDGRQIPQLGFGVFQIPPEETARAVETALRAGYRHIDTAAAYRNEAGVAEGLRRAGIARQDVFVTTKLWNRDHGRDAALSAFERSLERLGFDYVDLYLIHWPIPSRDLYVETWQALSELKADGRARSIGVSNFLVEHLERLIDETAVVPSVNQIELHPQLPQDELRRFDSEHGILTEAWSPLAKGGELLNDPVIEGIAADTGRTPAQVVLRWHIQLGNVVIPKSVTPARIEENLQLFDFELDDDQLEAISDLDQGHRTGPDPATFAMA